MATTITIANKINTTRRKITGLKFLACHYQVLSELQPLLIGCQQSACYCTVMLTAAIRNCPKKLLEKT